MGEHEQGSQIGVEVAPLDRTEFDYFMGWAQRLGMVDHWPVFACEVHAAVVVALGFAELTPDFDDSEARRIGKHPTPGGDSTKLHDDRDILQLERR